MPLSPLERIRDLSYRWGDCQAVQFDPSRQDVFPGLYLSNLWHDCRNSGRAKMGILEPSFPSMVDLSHDAVISYLRTRKLTILGEWRKRIVELDEPPRTDFKPLGFCFLSSACEAKNGNSGFGAYAFFEPAWRTDQQTVLTYLGIAFLFQEYKLVTLNGSRYPDNHLTARWMKQFGFVDTGVIRNSMVRYSTGELTDATISTLDREEFAARLGRVLPPDVGG